MFSQPSNRRLEAEPQAPRVIGQRKSSTLSAPPPPPPPQQQAAAAAQRQVTPQRGGGAASAGAGADVSSVNPLLQVSVQQLQQQQQQQRGSGATADAMSQHIAGMQAIAGFEAPGAPRNDVIDLKLFDPKVKKEMDEIDKDHNGEISAIELIDMIRALKASRLKAQRLQYGFAFFVFFLAVVFGVMFGAVKLNKDTVTVNGDLQTLTGDLVHVSSTERIFSLPLSSGEDNSVFDGLKSVTVTSLTGAVLNFQVAGYARLDDNSVYIFTHSSVSPALHLQGESRRRRVALLTRHPSLRRQRARH